MLLSDSRVPVCEFYWLMGWVTSRVEPWCGRFTSKRRNTILIDSLFSLCMYMMELYVLSEWVHSSFDKVLPLLLASSKCPTKVSYGQVRGCLHAKRLGWDWHSCILSHECVLYAKMGVANTLWGGGLWLQLVQVKYLQGPFILAYDCRKGVSILESI